MITNAGQIINSDDFLSDLELRRSCEYCGGNLKGRAEKRFCRDKCSTAFRKEEQNLDFLIYEFVDALKENKKASALLNIQDRQKAQTNSHRVACLISQILRRRSTVAPLVNRAIEVEFNNAVKNYLWNFTNRFDDYQDVFLDTVEPQIFEVLAQLTGVKV